MSVFLSLIFEFFKNIYSWYKFFNIWFANIFSSLCHAFSFSFILKTWTQMFREDLFVKFKIWKQFKYTSACKRINKLWCPNTRIVFNNKEEWTIDMCDKWMILKINVLSGRNQEKSVHTLWFHLYKIVENAN